MSGTAQDYCSGCGRPTGQDHWPYCRYAGTAPITGVQQQMSQQDEECLKPCPFCGGPAEMCDRDPDDLPMWVVCRACDVAGPRPGRSGTYHAAAAWNRRAPEHEKAAPTAREPSFNYVVPLVATPAMLDALDHAMPGQYKIGRTEAKKIWDAVVKVAPFHCIESSPPPVSAEQRERLEGRVRAILRGIEKTELEDADGWWETSTGAEFGAERLQALLAALCEEVIGGKP